MAMPDSGFPSQHTTTTTVSSSTTTIQPQIRFDPTYVYAPGRVNIPGVLKIVQLVLNLIGFICALCAHDALRSRANWFSFVTMTGLWITLILLLLYLFHLIEKLHFIPWLLIEFVYCAIWTFFYLIGASLCAASGYYDEALGVASAFGFLGMAAYGIDAYLKFRAWRNGELAQGNRTIDINKTSSTLTSPAY